MAASLVFDEGLAHGGQKGMRAALDNFLASRDPKSARRRTANSSADRARRNQLDAAPADVLLETLLKRFKLDRRRKKTAERVAKHRALHGRRDR
ncbi:MAG: hypothetical protein INR62_02730 [Rhodospirillales bacterium]|nr:hypothetical protein [Acetobacter sp.]